MWSRSRPLSFGRKASCRCVAAASFHRSTSVPPGRSRCRHAQHRPSVYSLCLGPQAPASQGTFATFGRDRIRIISIAGPSSSGKTTFIKRLNVQLEVNGSTRSASRSTTTTSTARRPPRDEDGEYDFEALEALDLARSCRSTCARLLAGEAVRTARYDFLTGQEPPGRRPGARARAAATCSCSRASTALNPALLGDAAAAGSAVPDLRPPGDHPPVRSAHARLADRRAAAPPHRARPAPARLPRRRQHPALAVGAARRARATSSRSSRTPTPSSTRSLVYEPAVLKVYAERYLLEVPRDAPGVPDGAPAAPPHRPLRRRSTPTTCRRRRSCASSSAAAASSTRRSGDGRGPRPRAAVLETVGALVVVLDRRRGASCRWNRACEAVTG